MIRRAFLTALLIAPLVVAGSVAAETPPSEVAPAAAVAAAPADGECATPLLTPAQSAPEPAVQDAEEPLFLAGGDGPVRPPCPFTDRTCNGYPYYDLGNGCCCPVKGICPCLCV